MLKFSDINAFIMQLQEQDSYVAGWSEGTVKRIVSVLINMMVENEYIDNFKSDRLNPVLISPVLENAIRNDSMTEALPAFNCLS